MLLQLEMFIELLVQLNIFRGISLEIPVIRLEGPCTNFDGLYIRLFYQISTFYKHVACITSISAPFS